MILSTYLVSSNNTFSYLKITSTNFAFLVTFLRKVMKTCRQEWKKWNRSRREIGILKTTIQNRNMDFDFTCTVIYFYIFLL